LGRRFRVFLEGEKSGAAERRKKERARPPEGKTRKLLVPIRISKSYEDRIRMWPWAPFIMANLKFPLFSIL
jgi:hypothetical protein